MNDSELANARRRKAAHAAFAAMPRNALLDAYLTDAEQALLVNLMTEVNVDADEVIIRQGEVGNNFFLIVDGECAVSIDDVDIGRRLAAGDHCGEIGLIEQTTRTATVTAVSPVRLLLVHKLHFMKAIGDSMFEKHRLFTPFLKETPLFGQLNSFELDTLIDRSVVIAYPPGSAVCDAADAAKFRLVFEGSIEGADGIVIEAGEHFGQLELLAGRSHERLFTASAAHGAICLEWCAPVFAKYIEGAFALPHAEAAAVREARAAYHGLLSRMASAEPGPEALAAHRRMPLRKAESAEPSDFALLLRSSSMDDGLARGGAVVAPKPNAETLAVFVRACKKLTIFESIDDALIGSFTAHMSKRAYKPGAVVFLEGEQGNHFYFVLSGALDMYVRGDGGWMRSFAPHDTFGELALYHQCRRQGTVVARDECVLWSIDRLTFNHVLLEENVRKAKQRDRRLLPALPGVDKLELHAALSNVQDERDRLIRGIAPVVCDDIELRDGSNRTDSAHRTDSRPTSLGRIARAAFSRLVRSPARPKNLKPLLPPITPPSTPPSSGSTPPSVSSQDSSMSGGSWSAGYAGAPSGGASRRLKFHSEELRVGDRNASPVTELWPKLTRLVRAPSAPMTAAARAAHAAPRSHAAAVAPRLAFDVQSVLVAPTLLGEGAYGTVHVVRHTSTADKRYALKQMCKKQLIAVSSAHRVVLESQLLDKMRSRFIVDKLASFQSADHLFLILDLMPGGDLYSLFNELPASQLDRDDLRAIMAHALLAVEHVHSRSVVHRDVKLENLLLADDGTVKLCDFGLAKTVVKRTFTLCGTPEYMAPEILNSTGYGRGVDYWALGIILYELFSGCGSPFAAENHLDVYSNILHTKPKFSARFPPQVIDLVSKLLEHDVGKRLGMLKNGVDDIKRHAFFDGYDWHEAPSMRDPRRAATSGVATCAEHEWVRLDLTPEFTRASAAKSSPISREHDKLFAGF